jgi:mutator protein MutT
VSAPPVFPVSIKGVVFVGERVVLLKNEREEWELPGGRLEAGESPPICVVREIREELAIDVRAAELLDCWLYEVLPGREVVIVTYGCRYDGDGVVRMSDEHSAVGQFDLAEIDGLPMPEGYRRSIRDWYRRRARQPA